MSAQFEPQLVSLTCGHCPITLVQDHDRTERLQCCRAPLGAPKLGFADLPTLSPLDGIDFDAEEDTSPPSSGFYPLNLRQSTSAPLSQERKTILDSIDLMLPLHVHTTSAHIGLLVPPVDDERRTNAFSDAYGHSVTPTLIHPHTSSPSRASHPSHSHSPHSYTTSEERITASHIFAFLQSLAQEPIPFRPTFVALQPYMQDLVRCAFYDRLAATTAIHPGQSVGPGHLDTIWSRFAAGHFDNVSLNAGAGSGGHGTGIVHTIHDQGSAAKRATTVSLPTPPPSAAPPPLTDQPLGQDLLLGNSWVWGFENISVAGYGVVHLDVE